VPAGKKHRGGWQKKAKTALKEAAVSEEGTLGEREGGVSTTRKRKGRRKGRLSPRAKKGFGKASEKKWGGEKTLPSRKNAPRGGPGGGSREGQSKSTGRATEEKVGVAGAGYPKKRKPPRTQEEGKKSRPTKRKQAPPPAEKKKRIMERLTRKCFTSEGEKPSVTRRGKRHAFTISKKKNGGPQKKNSLLRNAFFQYIREEKDPGAVRRR